MRQKMSVVLLGLLLLNLGASGQIVNLEKDRVPMTELAGLWRFHAGDDPSWSAPGFDDSGVVTALGRQTVVRTGLQGL
jgi:hypothetical protein